MLDNRDEQHHDNEDSEYHFSDDDISYDVEPETPTPPAAEETVAPSGSKGAQFKQLLSQHKRTWISALVFIVLVIIFYKMVVPSNTAPSTNITAPQAPAAMPRPAPLPTAAVAQPTPAPVPSQVAPAAMPTVPAVPTTPAAPTMPVSPAAPAALTTPAAPTVIPVATSPAPAPTAATMDAATAALVSENEKLVNELQTNAENQSKDMQNQINTLTTRVSNLETQLNELVQILTHGTAGASPSSLTSTTTTMPTPAPTDTSASSDDASVPVNYTVQAIIPGRAWLKSDDGEVVTVAEGDPLKGMGRVTKIDPYNGVVEINTGNKIVSLSYGSGGG